MESGGAEEADYSRMGTDRKGKGKALDKEDTRHIEGRVEVDGTEGRGNLETDQTNSNLGGQLVQLVSKLPPDATREQILDVRLELKSHDRLDDAGPVKALVAFAIRRNFDDIALRLMNESASLMLERRRTETKRTTLWMYVDAAQQLGRLKRWSAVVEVTNQAFKKGLVSAPLLHLKMRAFNKRSRYIDTIKTFDLYEEHGLTLDGPAYDEVIEAHLLNADLPKAQAVLAEKGEKGFHTTVQTCLTLFDGMALYGGNRIMEEKVLRDASEEELEEGKALRQDVRVLNKVMSVRAGRNEVRDALALLDYFQLDLFPSGLLDQFRQLPLPSPDSSLSEDRSSHLDHWKPRPDRSTIVTLVGIALRFWRADLASALLSSTHARSFQLNDHLVASIVRTLITEGSISAAEEFVFALPLGRARFNDFQYPSLQPGSFVYESLLSGILRFRGLAGVNECFRRLTKTNQPPLKVTEGFMKALVDYLALEKMKELGLSADLLVKVQRITSGRTKPTRENLNTLLKAAWTSERLSVHEWTNTRKSIVQEFPIPTSEDGMEPPRRPLPSIAELLARPKDPSAHRVRSFSRIRDSLSDRRIRHSSETAIQVLRNDHLIRFISAKWDYLQSQVLDLGVRPTYDHFTILIRAYLRLGDVKGANLALRYALNGVKIAPHVALYSTMISGLSRLGRHDLAYKMYEELQKTPGVEPDRLLFAALAMSCSRRRDVDGLIRIMDEVRNLVNSPRGRRVDPGFIKQTQIQTLARRRNTPFLVDSPSTSYDPLLDPVFVTIYYRTLNVTRQHLEAQQVMQSSLEQGLVPDPVVLQVLLQTQSWIKWKGNKEKKDGAVGDREEMKAILKENLSKVRRVVKGSKVGQGRKELKDMQAYWTKAEEIKDVDASEWADFFRDSKEPSQGKVERRGRRTSAAF